MKVEKNPQATVCSEKVKKAQIKAHKICNEDKTVINIIY